MQGCTQLLEDSEVRVREAVSVCIELLAQQHGPSVVQTMQPDIMQSIEKFWVSFDAMRC